MVEKIGQHTHCQMCGKAIPVSETLCSEDCKQKFQMMVKRRRILVYFLYGLMFIVLLMLVWNYLR